MDQWAESRRGLHAERWCAARSVLELVELGRDTTGHFVLMGALCLLVNLGFARADRHGTPVAVLRCTAWILLAVTLEEAVQTFIPIRSFSWLDLFSSYAGIGLGGLAAALLLSWKGRPPTD